jgi:hypothetical protein
MSRNGSGTYTAPSGAWNPAINGNSATAADWNALLADLAAAMTQSVSADGQTTITGNLNMGNNKLSSLAAGNASGQSLAWQQLFSQGTESDLASATTTDIGAQNTNFLRITGTTTITSFGVNYNGPRFLRFSGALTLTHNASTLILPAGANITTATGDTCIVLPISGGWYVSAYSRVGSSIPPQINFATTSGTSVDFTGIPSWAKRITISCVGVSSNGVGGIGVQLGSGTVQFTGYSSSLIRVANNSTTGGGASGVSFGVNIGGAQASESFSGHIILTKPTGTIWVASVCGKVSSGAIAVFGGGDVTLSGQLDRVRLTAGGDTFDGGSVSIFWE